MTPDAATLLITGRPGVGKTTVLRRAADRLADLALRGFYTEEVRGGSGTRTGFRALPFGAGGGHSDRSTSGSGARDGGDRAGSRPYGGRIIASVEIEGGPRVSKYGVDVEGVDDVTRRHLTADGADAVLVDEIGKMECYSDLFVSRIDELVAGDVPVVATVASRGGGLIRRVKEVPGTDLRELTLGNRDRAPGVLERWVRERTG